MKIKCFLILIFFSGIYACSTKTIMFSNDKILKINWDSIDTQKTFAYSTVFDSVQVVLLKNDSVLIGDISKMQIYDNALYILDSEKAKGVFIFSRDGAFIRKIGQIGNAPGEYLDCSDFTINEHTDEIYIYDNHSRTIYIYDAKSGLYMRKLNIEHDVQIQRIWCVDGKLYAVNTYFVPYQATDKYYILKELDSNTGRVEGEWLDSETYNKGWKDEFLHTNLFYPISDDKTLFAFGISDSIMCLSGTGLYPYIEFSGENIIKPSDIKTQEKDIQVSPAQRANAKIDMHMRLGKKNKIVAISDIFENGDILYFTCYMWHKNMVQYDLTSHKTIVFDNSVDDLMYSTNRLAQTIPSFLTSDRNGVYYMISTHYLPELKSLALEGKIISDKVKNQEILKEIDEDSNPVILFYDYKEK